MHKRSAERLLKLCYRNKGLYIKLGQYLASLHHALPKEYTQTLKVFCPPHFFFEKERERKQPMCTNLLYCLFDSKILQDHAPSVDYAVVERIFEEELGHKPGYFFREFNKMPLAAASLAQVS